jgi:hypothetical protein
MKEKEINYARWTGGLIGFLKSIEVVLALEKIYLTEEQSKNIRARIDKEMDRIAKEAKMSDSEYYEIIRNDRIDSF